MILTDNIAFVSAAAKTALIPKRTRAIRTVVFIVLIKVIEPQMDTD